MDPVLSSEGSQEGSAHACRAIASCGLPSQYALNSSALTMALRGFGSLRHQSLRHRMAHPPRGMPLSYKKARSGARLARGTAVVAPKHEDIVTVIPNPAVSSFPVPTDLHKYIDRPEIARANMVSDRPRVEMRNCCAGLSSTVRL